MLDKKQLKSMSLQNQPLAVPAEILCFQPHCKASVKYHKMEQLSMNQDQPVSKVQNQQSTLSQKQKKAYILPNRETIQIKRDFSPAVHITEKHFSLYQKTQVQFSDPHQFFKDLLSPKRTLQVKLQIVDREKQAIQEDRNCKLQYQRNKMLSQNSARIPTITRQPTTKSQCTMRQQSTVQDLTSADLLDTRSINSPQLSANHSRVRFQ
eukprot:EST44460.1 Hypothetical protein SS50377_15772 [Spironucleus salmonicida]